MTQLMKSRVVAVKHETTLGTAIALAAADATMNAFEVQMVPTLEFIARAQQGSASMLAGVIGKQHGTCTFKTHLSGNGAAASPGWLDALLPACGYIEATDTFSPNTAAPATTSGTGVNHTVTVGTYENGVKKFIAGAMGTFKLTMDAGGLVVIEWTFTGKWAAPIDATILAPTYDTVLPQRFGGVTMTIGGAAPGCVNNLTIDAGNTVTLRPCATDATGYETAIIPGRNIQCTWDPESRLVATEDVFGLWLAGTEEAFSLALTDGTDTITIAMPQAQRTNIQPAEREGVQVDNITFTANSASDAGDDELTIDFS